MVISNKPLQFIIAILIACLPIFGFSYTPSESTPAQTETTTVANQAAPIAEEETSHVVASPVPQEPPHTHFALAISPCP